MRDKKILIDGLSSLSFQADEKQIQQFEDYYDLLVEKNKVMNLTAITEYEEVVRKHFLDSLLFASCKLPMEKKKLLDLGTGAGFPGIPLKIMFPNTEFILMDALNKRISFLQEVIEKLGLTKIQAVHERAEEAAAKPEYREQFDYCVSRAVAKLSTLSEYCIPFVKVGGSFVSYKASDCEDECNEAKNAAFILAGGTIKTNRFLLPETDIERTFVIIEKKKHTEKKYPRAQGKPQKQPL